MLETLAFLICVICISLKKSYCDLAESAKDESSHRLSKNLRPVLNHTGFLNVLFDLIIMIAFSLFALSAAFDWDSAWAVLPVFLGLVIIFVLLPSLRSTGSEKSFAVFVSPVFAYFLRKLEKPVGWSEKVFDRIGKKFSRTRRLSKNQLRDFLKDQQTLAVEPIKSDLAFALAVLDLNDQKSGHIMIRMTKIKTVDADAHIGPVLLSELHKTGRKAFPVEDASQIVGSVRLDKLAELKAGGKVAEAFERQMIAVNKDEPALYAIKKFAESNAELIFTKDDSNKVVGAIYLEDILQELINAA